MDRAADYAYCDALLRRDKDRWLACLFLPPAQRPHVVALYAFSQEIAGVRSACAEPLLGEIRLQCWRDVLTGERAPRMRRLPRLCSLRLNASPCRAKNSSP